MRTVATPTLSPAVDTSNDQEDTISSAIKWGADQARELSPWEPTTQTI